MGGFTSFAESLNDKTQICHCRWLKPKAAVVVPLRKEAVFLATVYKKKSLLQSYFTADRASVPV